MSYSKVNTMSVHDVGFQRRGDKNFIDHIGADEGCFDIAPTLESNFKLECQHCGDVGLLLGCQGLYDGQSQSLNVVDDQNIIGFLYRVIDYEEADRETMHLLIFLLMQFLSCSDQAFPADERALMKAQGIVLRHLYLLLGYCQTDRGIYIPPQRLRVSPAFNAYLSNLPQLLDQNYLMGRSLLPTSLILLQYAPSPYYIGSGLEFQPPIYSLWTLEPHSRRSWLLSLLVLLYKYQYNQEPHFIQLIALMKIVINTLDSQHHRCRKIPPTLIMGPQSTRSRDVSQPSLGTEIEHERLITPPLSPMYSLDGHSCQISVSSKTGKVQVSYNKPSSTNSMETHWEETGDQFDRKWNRSPKKMVFDIDDSESDLLAIPESDISDSTIQGSAEDSLEENIEDIWQSKADTLFDHSTASSEKRPTWFIGSEEEYHESQFAILPRCKWFASEYPTNCVKMTSLGTSSLASTLAVVAGVPNLQMVMANAVTADSHIATACIEAKHVGKQGSINRSKNIIEPHFTALYTSDYDTTFNDKLSNHVLSAPSLERLLPIGSLRSPVLKGCRPILTDTISRSPDSPLSKMEIMIIESPKDKNILPDVDSELQLPQHERLLPIGQANKDISQLIDQVKQALGLESQTPKVLQNHEYFCFEVPQSHSPRRLIKQVALESPPSIDADFEQSIFCDEINVDNKRDNLVSHRQNVRKSGIFSIGAHCLNNTNELGSWYSPQLSPRIERNELKQSSFRIGEDSINERCSECGIVKEEYSDEEIGLCIVTLGTFIHKEPILASPLLPDILSVVSKLTTDAMYPWQNESTMHLPGGAISVAHQFLRCVLYQLTPNGIFTQMFQTHINEKSRMHFFKSVTQALTDFSELNPITPLQFLLESLNARKTLPVDSLAIILENMACYFECLPLEASLSTGSTLWSNVLLQVESLFRRILLHLGAIEVITPLLRIMISVLKIPIITQYKGLLEPFSKVLGHAIQSHIVQYSHLSDLCYLCNRAFIRERDKLILSRMAVFELVQALKFKTLVPDSNLLILIALILQDAGGSLPINVIVKENLPLYNENGPLCNTNVSDCMRLHLGDIVEFLTDFHTLTRLKSYCKGINIALNEDTIGGLIKGSIAQYLALEVTKGNGRDNRAITKYFPWLYSTAAAQQTPREFMESISHVRLLSWLLLGSLTHSALHGIAMSQHFCQPIPQDASCLIADHIQAILAGFSEQPKTSVLHMSSLFHSFILCQLWTVYLEQNLNTHIPVSEAYNITMNILFEFWGKVTPCILQLVQQSKMMGEIVSLHFLSMLEALLECHSALIGKLLPLWTPVLCSNSLQLPGHLQVRLQNCHNFAPNTHYEVLSEKTKYILSNPILLKWLQRLQFKMGQIELQSSAATQFYSL